MAGRAKKKSKRSKRRTPASVQAPAPATKPEPPPAPTPKAIADLGAPPEDPLATQAYLYRMLALSAHDAANDPKLSARERRKELRTITASAAKLMPRARLWQAEQLVLEQRAEIAAKKAAKRGATLEPWPRPSSAPAPAIAESPTTAPSEADGPQEQ